MTGKGGKKAVVGGGGGGGILFLKNGFQFDRDSLSPREHSATEKRETDLYLKVRNDYRLLINFFNLFMEQICLDYHHYHRLLVCCETDRVSEGEEEEEEEGSRVQRPEGEES